MFRNFTRRNRLDYPKCDLQYEYIPPAFRQDLYKAVKSNCEGTVNEYILYRDSALSINKDTHRFSDAEEIDENYNPDFFITLLLQCEWHEVLSLVEFFVNNKILDENEVNELFEYHKVGYRFESDDPVFMAGKVIVHFDTLIEDTRKILESDIKYAGVIASIKAAKKSLLEPENISLAQSIKHSIDAIEGYLKEWLANKKIKAPTLGEAIKKLQVQKLYPDHILKSLEQFYIYRNMTGNVGHGSAEIAEITKEDAKLCLEMAISFINYFHRKS